jgi:hypothetical protein
MNPDYSMGDAIANSVKKMESIASKGYDHLYGYLAHSIANGEMSASTAESLKNIYGPFGTSEAIASNPAVLDMPSIAEKKYTEETSSGLFVNPQAPKGTSGEALKTQLEAQLNTYTSIAEWAKDNTVKPLSAKDISTAILTGSTEGSHLSYVEMKQIVHGMAYGKMPTNVQMQKCSSVQYNFLLGKHHEFASKGGYMGPTEEQLEFHDPVQMTEEQKYKQELNNVKMKLEKTDTSLPTFWTELTIAMPPQMQPLIKAVKKLQESDFRIKAVQFTQDLMLDLFKVHILPIKGDHLVQAVYSEIVHTQNSKSYIDSIVQDIKHVLDDTCVISPAEFAEIAQNHLMDQKKKQEHIQAQKKYEALLANPPQGVKGTLQVAHPPLQMKSKKQNVADATLTAIATMFPNAATFECKCPVCGYDATVMNQVIHMNDNHDECTREYIADYLETLDCDLQIKETAK